MLHICIYNTYKGKSIEKIFRQGWQFAAYNFKKKVIKQPYLYKKCEEKKQLSSYIPLFLFILYRMIGYVAGGDARNTISIIYMIDDGSNASKGENFRIKSLNVYATQSILYTVIGTISRAYADILEKKIYI